MYILFSHNLLFKITFYIYLKSESTIFNIFKTKRMPIHKITEKKKRKKEEEIIHGKYKIGYLIYR